MGTLAFRATAPGRAPIEEEYQIDLWVPEQYPDRLPEVRETGGRIPPSFHMNHDGTLCLGSPTRLRLVLSEGSSLLRFVERCVVPYLYGHSYFETCGALPFGELPHGAAGILQDLMTLFGTDHREAVPEFLRLAAMTKRQANKMDCPCKSGRRVGRCHHRKINGLRRRLGRHWFAAAQRDL